MNYSMTFSLPGKFGFNSFLGIQLAKIDLNLTINFKMPLRQPIVYKSWSQNNKVKIYINIELM